MMRHVTRDDQAIATAEATIHVFFPTGLIGCPTWRWFLLAEPADLPGIAVLQSHDVEDVHFLLMRAAAIAPDFGERVHPADAATLAALGVGERNGVEVFCTLNTCDRDGITANLLGPLVIDRRRGTGQQVVLGSSPWPTRLLLTTRGIER